MGYGPTRLTIPGIWAPSLLTFILRYPFCLFYSKISFFFFRGRFRNAAAGSESAEARKPPEVGRLPAPLLQAADLPRVPGQVDLRLASEQL